MAAVCRSMPICERLTISDRKRCASRAASEPVAEPGKRAVEVAPVGQIARAADEAEHVDDGDAQKRAADALGMQRAQQPADDLDAVQLIAVDGRGDEHGRPRPRAMQHVHRQGDRRVIGQLRYGQVDEPALARLHGQSPDDKRLPHDDAFHWDPTHSHAHEVHERSGARKTAARPHPCQYWQRKFRCAAALEVRSFC